MGFQQKLEQDGRYNLIGFNARTENGGVLRSDTIRTSRLGINPSDDGKLLP